MVLIKSEIGLLRKEVLQISSYKLLFERSLAKDFFLTSSNSIRAYI